MARILGLVFVLSLLILSACGDHDASAVGESGVQPIRTGTLLTAPSPDGLANSASPTLRWQADRETTSWRIRLYADPKRQQMLAEGETTSLDWTAPVALSDAAAIYTELEGLDAGGSPVVRDQSRFRMRITPRWLPKLELVKHDAARAFGGYRLFNIFDILNFKPGERIACLAVINGAGEYAWWYLAKDAHDLIAPDLLPNGNLVFVHRKVGTNYQVSSRAVEIDWDGKVQWTSPAQHMVHHDVRPGPLGAYLTLTWTWKSFGGVSYEGDKLELLDPATGASLWSWNLFDHFDPVQHPTPDQDKIGRSYLGNDWSHANAAVWDASRGLIWLCARNLDSLIGIEYPSGKIRTVLGRHGIGGPDLINHSHAPAVLDDGSILLFDNGNTRPNPISQVLRFRWDELSQSATELFTWVDDPPFYDASMGDADLLANGNYLVTAGQSARMLELSPSGEILWDLRIDQSERPRWTYRSVQLPALPTQLRPF